VADRCRGAEGPVHAGPAAPLTAAVLDEREDEVRRLLSEGHNPDWPDREPGITPWQAAVLIGHQPSLDLFASHDHARPSSHYIEPLFKAALQRGDARLVSAFIRGGAWLTFGDTEYSPLSIAAANGFDDVMQVLLGAGVDVNAQNAFGDTALMAAVRSGRLEAVQLLLDRGARLRLKDREGRDAMAWAVRMGRRSIIDALAARGAESSGAGRRDRPLVSVRTAAARSLVLLQESGDRWLERTACASCHQALLVRVAAVARRHGFAVDETRARAHEEWLRSVLASMGPGLSAGVADQNGTPGLGPGFFGPASGAVWLQSALAADARRRRQTDEKLAVLIGRSQMSDGRWRAGAPWPPVLDGDIQATALAIRVFLIFTPSHPDTQMRVERARAWLLTSEPVTTLDRAFLLLGLRWAGADRTDVKRAMKELLRDQDDEGGWAQLPGLNADAYATGVALVALYQSGEMLPSHHAFQRGVAYLMRTQEEDGSWFLHKRAASFHPYFDSGFPHGMFQFSSFAGTAWAAMALMYASGPDTP